MAKHDFHSELSRLVEQGARLAEGFLGSNHLLAIEPYQDWYTRALATVTHLLPDRLQEFQSLYCYGKRSRLDEESYTIKDYLEGLRSPPAGIDLESGGHIAAQKLFQQVFIVKSAESRLDDILSNVKRLLQADLFDSDLEAAQELLKNGYMRASGMIAGVVLEQHLKAVCDKHGIAISKKSPGISDYNDALKNASLVEVSQWRFIQHLGDIRNLCGHAKGREPTKDEADELIRGVAKIAKTLL